MTLATARQRLAILGYRWNIHHWIDDLTGVGDGFSEWWEVENAITGEHFDGDTLDAAVNGACETEPAGLAKIVEADGQLAGEV